MRGGLSERIGRLERHRSYVPAKPLSKCERDELVRAALAGGGAAFLAGETDPHRLAVIGAAMRADH